MWIWWPGTSDPKDYKALVDTSTQCTLMSSRGKIYLYFWGDNGIPTAGCTGSWSEPDCERTAKTPQWRVHRSCAPLAQIILQEIPQDKACQGPKRALLCFGIAAVKTEEVRELNILPDMLEDPSEEGMQRVEEADTNTYHSFTLLAHP